MFEFKSGARALFITASLCVSSLPAPAFADEPLAFTSTVRAGFDAAAETATRSGRGAAPAVAVAVVENGALVYAHAAGTSDVATGTAATTATRFRVGSLTKMFTAVAILQLVESGKIAIDEPLATYLPDAPHAREVTTRQLLTHTSGLAEYAKLAVAAGAAAKPTTPQGIVDRMATEPLDFVPGHGYRFSNTNYVLLGLEIERVSGQSLEAYERRTILGPAAMTQTSFAIVPAAAPAAVGYLDTHVVAKSPLDPTWLYATGDAITTASDLARFDIALMGGKLLAPATLQSMTTGNVKPDAAGSTYGLGMTLRPFGGVRLAGHNGGLPGFEALDEMDVAQRFGVIVLGNSSGFAADGVELSVLRTLLPADYARFDAERQRQTGSEAASADPKISALLRSLISGLQHGEVDRTKLSPAMNVAFTADTLATLRVQFTKLGALTSLAFRGKSPDPKYGIYDYTGTFASSAQTVPLRLVLGAGGKVEGFYQQ